MMKLLEQRGRCSTAGAVLALLAAGCGGDIVQPVRDVCDGEVELIVTSTPLGDPVIAWSPDCVVTSLIIEPVGRHGDVYWKIETATTPVEYGRLPAGATLVEGPRDLEPGTDYIIAIAGERAAEVGFTTFRR